VRIDLGKRLVRPEDKRGQEDQATEGNQELHLAHCGDTRCASQSPVCQLPLSTFMKYSAIT
jgi:hypothetical protein